MRKQRSGKIIRRSGRFDMSSQTAAARAVIAALTSTAMAERWRANGFEPPK
jgi:hypothetical protein